MDLLPDLRAANQQLVEQGWAVVPNVLNQTECEQGIDGIWQWLSTVNPNIKRDEPSSWNNRNWPITMHQIIQHYGVGQQEFVWNIRTNPRVQQVFSYLWDTQNLITSFDGINVTRPPETGHIQYHNDQRSWLHLDQGPRTTKRSKAKRHRRKKDPSCACIQGFVSLEDADTDDAVLQLYEGSHHLHDAFFERMEESKHPASDWYKLSPEDDQWYRDQGCRHLRISVPAGGMVLWDSRTVHSGSVPMANRQHSDRWRYIVYTCMTPKSFCSLRDLRKRIGHVENGRMTTHWPHYPKLFPVKPRTYGKDVELPEPLTRVWSQVPRSWKNIIA